MLYAAQRMMRSDKRGQSRWTRQVLAAGLLVAGLSACTALAGGAAVLGAVSIGVLTSRCYDYVDVTVLDAEGRKTCAATVTASKGSSQFELPSCYYGALTDGLWTVRASLPGSGDATAQVQVDHTNDCTRYVQSLELTLKPKGAPTSLLAVRPVPAAPTQAPTAPSASTISPTQSAEPPASSAAPASAPPTSSVTPPVGVFPDSVPTTH